jgi:hypothetical protein
LALRSTHSITNSTEASAVCLVLRVGGENGERRKEEEGKKNWEKSEKKTKKENLNDVVGKWERERGGGPLDTPIFHRFAIISPDTKKLLLTPQSSSFSRLHPFRPFQASNANGMPIT